MTMWSNTRSSSVGLMPGRATLGPLFLISVCPVFILLLHHALIHTDGSLTELYTKFANQRTDFWSIFYQIFPSKLEPKLFAVLGGFTLLQMVLLRVVPGPMVSGPTTPAGNTPQYRSNGLPCYIITLSLYSMGVYLGYFNGGFIYDNMKLFLATLSLTALIVCAVLYIKGLVAPSSTDSGRTGNFIFDYYWGTELHPRFLGWDVKQLTNCRLGMHFWALIALSCAYKQYELFGAVSNGQLVNSALQIIYLGKFFHWEDGYFSSLDIMHDRAGFYIVWGVLAWVPGTYTCHSMYLASRPRHLHWLVALSIFLVGVASIYITYDSDKQRQEFRATKGSQKIWGRAPRFIKAYYTTETGTQKHSLLLASGWWGLSRHFHYLTEISGAICWTLPAATLNLGPNFYIIFLVLLLVDRAVRDDARCKAKYGDYWAEYCQMVPWLIMPGFF